MEVVEATEVLVATVTKAVRKNEVKKALELDSLARKPPAGLASRFGAAGAKTGLRVQFIPYNR